MYNTSFRIVTQKSEAEDIMQESFLKAFINLHEYRGDVSFGAWLKKIVINKSIDAVRKRKINFASIDSIDGIDSLMINDEADENLITDRVSPEVIFREIEKLPDGYRIVLSLYLTENYSHDEISKILNISPSTSRSQYMRAKAKLLNNLKKKYLK